jgi:hypothetical protein
MLPLASIVKELLAVGARGMGRPVEIEFAGTLAPDGHPEFYVLQIRPLVTLRERQQVVIGDSDLRNALIFTDMALGNGAPEGFGFAPSQGTHFFHSITALGVMYLTVPHSAAGAFTDWEEIDRLPVVADRKYVRHLRLPCPVVVKVDGRSGKGAVFRSAGARRS